VSDSDLIRRGDVVKMIQTIRETDFGDLRDARDQARMLPADPVAEAALALAEAVAAEQYVASDVQSQLIRYWRATWARDRSALAARQTNVPGKSAGDGDRT